LKELSAAAGDFLKPDGWAVGEILQESDGYRDSSFPGCMFRLPGGFDYRLAVNVTVTGRKPDRKGWLRCRVEFVGDGEPSQFCGGVVYPKG
jgi:hypothetical protein